MATYDGLTQYYDAMMAGVDYESWADYVTSTFDFCGRRVETILDLACGTGNTSLPLAARGFQVTGLDLSPAMLAAARRKVRPGLPVRFVEGNMTALTYDHCFDAAVSFQDGINYLIGDDDFERLCGGVKNALRNHGLFCFDLNLVDKYERQGSDTAYVVDNEDIFMVYESHYDKSTALWQVKVTGFLPAANGWQRFDECHHERAYDLTTVQTILQKQGFTIRAIWAMFNRQAPTDDTRRVMIVTQKEPSYAHRPL